MNPVYIAVCYRYSIEFGGRVLKEIAALMRAHVIVAIHLEVDGAE